MIKVEIVPFSHTIDEFLVEYDQEIYGNQSVIKPKRKVVITCQDNIKKLEDRLEAGEISAREFLGKASHSIKLPKKSLSKSIERGGADAAESLAAPNPMVFDAPNPEVFAAPNPEAFPDQK